MRLLLPGLNCIPRELQLVHVEYEVLDVVLEMGTRVTYVISTGIKVVVKGAGECEL